MHVLCTRTEKHAADGITVSAYVEGEIYEVADSTGARLIELGIATEAIPAEARAPFNPVKETKPAAPVDETKEDGDLSALTVKQLTELAATLGLELAGRENKAKLIEAITAKQAELAAA